MAAPSLGLLSCGGSARSCAFMVACQWLGTQKGGWLGPWATGRDLPVLPAKRVVGGCCRCRCVLAPESTAQATYHAPGTENSFHGVLEVHLNRVTTAENTVRHGYRTASPQGGLRTQDVGPRAGMLRVGDAQPTWNGRRVR